MSIDFKKKLKKDLEQLRLGFHAINNSLKKEGFEESDILFCLGPHLEEMLELETKIKEIELKEKEQ